MFIKTEDGNLVNTNYISEITISGEPFRDGTYGVVAHIHMNGSRILGRHSTKEEAIQQRDGYYQMY